MWERCGSLLAFINCDYAKACWDRSGLHSLIDEIALQCEGFTNLVFIILRKPDSAMYCRLVMVLWQIWKKRNATIWGERCKTPAEAVFLSASFLDEWTHSQWHSMVSRT